MSGSALQQSDQPGIYVYSLCFGFPSHLSHHRASRRVLCSIQYVLISYLFYMYYQYMLVPVFQFIPHTPFSLWHPKCLFSVSVSLFLLCRSDHLYHFLRFHIYALIYDICSSLSDWLHSIWESVGPTMSLQMTQFHSFLWLRSALLHICTTSSLPFLCWWTLRLLACPDCCE